MIEARDVAQAKRSVVIAGAGIEGAAGNLIQALVAPGQLTALVASAGVGFVRLPLGHVEDTVTDEAVAATNAGTWHGGGIGGAGVKLAIIG